MSLKPGPELDRLVAKALGWEELPFSGLPDDPMWLPPNAERVHGIPKMSEAKTSLPPFSTDPGEAIKALEEFCEKYPEPITWEVTGCVDGCEASYRCQITSYLTKKTYDIRHEETLSYAICLAIDEAAGVKT